MNKIQNIQQLRLERQRLFLKKEMLEDDIRQDFNELRESLKPLNIVKDLFGMNTENKMNGVSEVSSLTKNIGSTLLDMIITGVLFRKSSYLKKFLSTFLVYTTGPTLIGKIAPLIKNYFNGWMGSAFENNRDNGQSKPTVTENY